MSDSVTLPLKAALTGPMRRRTLAFISVSDSLLQRFAARNAGLQHGRVVQRRKDLFARCRDLVLALDFHLVTPG